MNFSDFLNQSRSSKSSTKSSFDDFSTILRTSGYNGESTKSSSDAENMLKKLKGMLKDSHDFEVKQPEALFPTMKQQIKSVQKANTYIRDLAVYQSSQKIKLNPSNRYNTSRSYSIFKIIDPPALFTFRSRPNNIKTGQLVVTRKRKKIVKNYEFVDEPEDYQSLAGVFKDHNIDLKHRVKRISLHELSSKAWAISEKARTRGRTLFEASPLKPILSESSSSSEDEEIVDYFTDRQAMYKKSNKYHNPYEKMELTEITNKDYKLTSNKPLTFISPEEISNGEAVKFGYLLKRKRESTNFHKRWVVLRGFKLFWYRKHSSTMAQRVVHLGKSLVYHTEAGKEKCLAIASKERSIQFKFDATGAEWKKVLNSQICFKGYLDEYKDFNMDLLEYFQDLNSNQLILNDFEIGAGLFQYFINALPAHSKLQTLTLTDCKLTDNDIINMCELLKANCSIQTLDISKNYLTSKCIYSVSSVIKQEEPKYNTILHLNLSDNSIGDEGIEALSRAFGVRFEQLFLPKLIHQLPFLSLKLNRIEMGDIGLNAITTIINKANNLMQGEDVEAKITLELSGNYFGYKSFNKFAETIAQYQGIRELDISCNINLCDQEIIFFAQAVSSNLSLASVNIAGISLSRAAYEKVFMLLSQNYALAKVHFDLDKEFKIAVVEKGHLVNHAFEISK